jgi:hypothetical protein
MREKADMASKERLRRAKVLHDLPFAGGPERSGDGSFWHSSVLAMIVLGECS